MMMKFDMKTVFFVALAVAIIVVIAIAVNFSDSAILPTP
jgi:hypothetical protein